MFFLHGIIFIISSTCALNKKRASPVPITIQIPSPPSKKKKEFKQRFWAEIYDGAKLFFFSGLQYGRYPKTEVSNLARFIAVQKTPIVAWRAAHPYLLAHRVEDQTDPNDPNAESRRKLHIYGYTYGARLREGQFVHLAGVGDFPIAGLEAYTDPCPSPLVQERERAEAAGRLDDRGKKKINNLRTLQEKHKAVGFFGTVITKIFGRRRGRHGSSDKLSGRRVCWCVQ